jgi:hypothetical protein
VYGLQPNIARTVSTGESTWTIYTDADGFRCAKTPSHPNAPELLVLGDSFPFGMGVNYEESIPGRIDAAFAGKFRVANSGVPGYGPIQYRQVLERELKRSPLPAAVLAITYMGNDWHDCIWNKSGNVRNGIINNEVSLRSFVKQNFHLYRLATNTLHRVHQDAIDTRPHEKELYIAENWAGKLQPARDIYRDEFLKIRDLCQAHNIPLLVAIIPTAQAVDQPSGPAYLPVTKAKEIFDAAAIRYVDTTTNLAKAGMVKTYFGWDQHLNPTGNRLAAQAIVDAWAPQ